jgi:hypothetical protein
MSAAKTLCAYALCLAVLFSSACQNKTVVTKVDPAKPGTQKGEGVIFSLPQTVVVSEVPVTKVESSPGVFSKWTGLFYPELTSDDFTTEKKATFKIGAPTFSTRGQTDPDNIYMAHIKAGLFETKTLLVEFNDDGIIARTETSSKDESIDIVTSGIKTVASIVAPLLPVGMGAAPTDNTHQNKDAACLNAEGNARKKAQDAKDAQQKYATTNNANDKQAADAAEAERKKAFAAASECNEEYFKRQLTATELSLYESLDDNYKKFLRENFGFDFLIYLAKKESNGDNTFRSADVAFFFTLGESQQKVVKAQPRSTSPCTWETEGLCMSQEAKAELIKAKAAFDKIQGLRQKREELATKDTPAAVTTSTNLELKLRELDNQIKGLEQTYFLGTSSETSSTAKFEFKPEGIRPDGTLPGDQPRPFFTYAAGGAKPGICKVEDEQPGAFKATWPKNLKGECHKDSQEFEPGDFRDLKAFAEKLKGGMGGGADLVTNDLYANRLTTARGLLGHTDTPQQRDALLRALIADLNGIVNGGTRLDTLITNGFDAVKLSADTIKLLNKAALTAEELKQLNRLLLEDAYPDYLYRRAAWAGKQVALTVRAAPNGIAQSVQTAKLKQDGKRGFPYRVPALTMALLTDDGVEKGRSEVRVAQLGPVQTLPASLGGRRSSYNITYYDASGAIKTFNMSADALVQKQNVTDLADAATSLRDAETTRIKRETDRINAKKDKAVAEKALQDAQKALEAASPTPTPTPTPTPE